MENTLSSTAGIFNLILLSLNFHYANSQLTLNSYKDSTGKYGYKDKYWKAVIIPAKYENADYFREGLAPVKLNGKWGFIDKSGMEVIPLKYQDAVDFNEGATAVKAADKWGFIDKTGKEITSIKYETVTSRFQEGIAGVSLDSNGDLLLKQEKKLHR